ncbi:MAG: hypothetical protein M3N59_01265 [bacterium]|nr:hypothetical protein [bacterium]
MRWLPNLVTLLRVPVIILLVLPAFSLGSDSPKLAFWLYIVGLLSHGLDGALAKRLIPMPHDDRSWWGFWDVLDTVVLSLGLQLAAAIWIFNELGISWLTAVLLLALYVVAAAIAQFGYVDFYKQRSESFFPIVLYGSGVVWLVLGGMLAYQVYGTTWSVLITGVCLFIYGPLIHQNVLHPQAWNDWWAASDGKH